MEMGGGGQQRFTCIAYSLHAPLPKKGLKLHPCTYLCGWIFTLVEWMVGEGGFTPTYCYTVGGAKGGSGLRSLHTLLCPTQPSIFIFIFIFGKKKRRKCRYN
jgi:hypothetical protein